VTKGNPAWEKFEHEVQDLLALRSTPGSGNQWHDVGDGRSVPEDPYRLIVDCKHTEGKSYSLSGSALQAWVNQAGELGFHFALPVRLAGAAGRDKDWVAVPLDDYAELVDSIRILNGPTRCGVLPQKDVERDIFHPITWPCIRRLGHFSHHDNGQIEWSA
jgi:hypothetical protein